MTAVFAKKAQKQHICDDHPKVADQASCRPSSHSEPFAFRGCLFLLLFIHTIKTTSDRY